MTTTDPKPNDVYRDDAGWTWTVIAVHSQPSVILENNRGERIMPAIDSPMFQSMRAKSSSPPPRVEPPEEFAGEENHWLFTGRSGRDEFVLREWGWSEENQDRAWLVAGVAREYTPEEIAAKGWSWHSVASPCKPDTRIEPTDADPITPDRDYCAMDAPTMLRAVGDDARKWADAFMQITAKYDHPIDAEDMIGWFANAIEHSGDVRRWRAEKAFPAPPSRIEVSEEATDEAIDALWREVIGSTQYRDRFRDVIRLALVRFSPTQPAPVQQEMSEAQNAAAEEASRLESGFGPSLSSTLAQREITDEELNRIASENSEFMFGAAFPIRFNWDGLHKFAHALLSKHRPTLSNKTLDTLYDLAKTEEREQFKNDAKMVVGRKG